jgi:CheY-like chemotaxis protein
LQKIKTLVADDSAAIHRIFRNALRKDPSIELIHAGDGAECLEAMSAGVDVAFIDVHMPQMSGTEALWSARSRGSKTFVTLISGRANRRCVEMARQLEAYELLLKPFGGREIQSILDTYRRIAAPMRVLLVDDSPTLLKVMRKVLTNSIFHLDIEDASNGAAALARCEAEPFDVVFMDYNMPGLNGLATLVRLRTANPGIKVVMISSERNVLREREAVRLGAAAFLHKPFFPTEIDAVLHQVFGLRSPKLATEGTIRDFEIKIHGRTVAVQHEGTGHLYQYIWFPEPPHLRAREIRENPAADVPASAVRPIAEKAAILELRQADLLNGARH